MLFNRVCSLVVGTEGGTGLEIRGLRMAFSIQKGSVKTPNKCTVRVWNVRKTMRPRIEAIGLVLVLRAGYSEDIGEVTLFAGDVTRSYSYHEGPDIITELELADGFSEFRDKKITVSYAAGATTLQVLRDITKRFGLTVRSLPTDVPDKQYKNGFAFVGRCRDAMDKACEYMGLEWSIQNREVQVIKRGGTVRQKAYLLTPKTGLLGSPMQESQTMTEKAGAKLGYTEQQRGVSVEFELDRDGTYDKMLRVYGYKVLTLLQPLIEPGGFVQVRSDGIDGEFFRVEELTHVGDTHGKEWHTELLLRYP